METETIGSRICAARKKMDYSQEEMYELMENIKSPEMRRLALKQLRCVAEV